MSEQNHPIPTYDGTPPPESVLEDKQPTNSRTRLYPIDPNHKSQPSHNPFPVLTFVSALLKLLGWITVLAGSALVITGVQGDGMFGIYGPMAFLIGIGGLGFGFGAVALGESIGVLFAIEANTRKMAERS